MAFSLATDADEGGFLECNSRLQTEFAYRQAGLLRRTVARGSGRAWMVVDLWQKAEDADACAARWETDALAQEWMSHVDRTSVAVTRWETLD